MVPLGNERVAWPPQSASARFLRALPCVWAVAGGLLSAPVHAQLPQQMETGSRIKPIRMLNPAVIKPKGVDKEGIAVMREFARCTYGRSATAVARAVALAPGEDAKALADLASGACLAGGQLRFDPRLFRGALYGELFRQRERAGKDWKLSAVAFDQSVAPPAESPFVARLNYFMLDLAACVYAESPIAVRNIVLHQFGSDEYDAAFANIIPRLGPCAPSGMTLKLNHMSLEHAFGEYLYRAQPVVPPSEMGAF